MGDGDVYRSVSGDLMRFAAAVGGREEAGDLVATVVSRVLERPGGLSGLRDAKPYLMRAVVNEVRSRNRERVRKPVVSLEASAEPSVGIGVDEMIDLVLSLPPRQRAAVYLTAYEGYNSAEVGRLLGCRASTVRRYLHLARQKLREADHG